MSETIGPPCPVRAIKAVAADKPKQQIVVGLHMEDGNTLAIPLPAGSAAALITGLVSAIRELGSDLGTRQPLHVTGAAPMFSPDHPEGVVGIDLQIQHVFSLPLVFDASQGAGLREAIRKAESMAKHHRAPRGSH